ncbi:MAG: RluA family pseudouridine synthase [Lachnospiraceae bacterium]|nr:RluA family pseudouridine synthase [Lachnospiraceae bacterium]
MRQITISHMDAGRRLDGFLQKTMPAAGLSFIYKMLRKKNITVNGKKCDGNYKLNEGDVISVFFSDETYEKMTGLPDAVMAGADIGINIIEYLEAYKKIGDISIVYEDEDYIFADKPAGILSQKAEASDLSMNEWLVGRMLSDGTLDEERLKTFKPAFANRLDRNTSGLILGGKSLKALQTLSAFLKDRRLHKYYLCLAFGRPDEKLPVTSDGFTDVYARMVKDRDRNIAHIISGPASAGDTAGGPASARDKTGAFDIHTGFRLAGSYSCDEKDYMLLEVCLHTGRSHQIRAQLSALGHPIAGDVKYGSTESRGDIGSGRSGEERTGQLLHAYRVVFPDSPDAGAISGREFKTSLPSFAALSGADK